VWIDGWTSRITVTGARASGELLLGIDEEGGAVAHRVLIAHRYYGQCVAPAAYAVGAGSVAGLAVADGGERFALVGRDVEARRVRAQLIAQVRGEDHERDVR